MSDEGKQQPPIVLFTMGFAKKNARDFFRLLQNAGVRRLVDIRLNNVSQLAGFTKKDDLAFFLRAIAGIEYLHRPDLAPTKDILDAYKKKRIAWGEYERQFKQLMEQRQPERLLSRQDFDRACLLCSEPKADQCHRRLVAEYLRNKWQSVEVRHL